MPGLYGFTGNSNVSVNVGNTIGLYQQNTGNVYVVNNAITLLNTLSQAGNVNFALTSGNTKVLAYTANIGTTAGTYGDATYVPQITVTSDGRVTGIVNVQIPGVGPGGYGNANVQAYLASGAAVPILTTGNITTTANIISPAYLYPNGVSILTGIGGTYSNTNVAAYLTTATIATTGNITAGNLISANFLYPNGVSILTGIGGTYSNTNVAAYLTTATITTTGNITGANLTTAGNLTATYVKGNGSLLTNLPTQAGTYSNTNVSALLSSNTVSTITTTGNITTVANIVSPAYLYPNGVSILSGIGGTYSNTNVAAYLTTATITTTGNVTAANLITAGNVYGSYIIGDGSLVTNLPVQAGTYSNTNVAAYLTTATISTSGNITAANLITAGNVSGNYVIGNGSLLTNLPVQAGTYSNTNVAAYLTTATISTSGNVTAANLTTAGNLTATYVKGNAASMTGLTGVAAGVYGSDTVIPAIQIDASGRIIGITSNIVSGSGSYGNSNVAAYLPTYTGSMPNLTSINTSGNITANSGAYFIGDGSKLTNLPVQAGTYSNTNVSAYLTTATITTTGNVTAGNLISNNFLYPNGVSILTGVTSTYSNANVAAYLPTFSGTVGGSIFGTASATTFTTSGGGGDLVISNPNGIVNITSQGPFGPKAVYITSDAFVTIDTLTINATGNLNVTQTANVGNLITTGGVYWSNGNPYSTGGGVTQIIAGSNITISPGGGTGIVTITANTQSGTYSNANVASYLPVFGGNILAGNVNIPYTSGTRNRGPLAVGGNISQYDTGVIASFIGNEPTYLYTSLQNSNSGNTAYSSYALNDDTHTYYGELGINSSTYDYAAAGYPDNAFSKPYATFLQSTGANLAIGTYGNYGVNFVVNGGTVAADAMTIANTGNVTVTGNLSVNTLATVGNIKSTNGYFWANGTAYSTGSGGTAFTGDLVGNTLTASGTGRILANAYPQSNVVQVSTYTQGVLVTTAPSYTGANLNSQNQTVSFVASGNVNLLTSFAAGTRTTLGSMAYLGLTATSSNTQVNVSDRVRAFAGGLDINLNGKNWGALTSASNTLLPIVVNGQTLNVYGTGQVGHAIGIADNVTLTPVNGSISAQYVSGYYSTLTYASTGGGYTASNIQNARLYTGVITGVTGNLTVNNAIGLHTTSGWVSANVSLVNNAYALLNEDTRTIIQTAGNIVATTTSNVILGAGQMVSYRDKIQALGTTSTIAFDGNVAPSYTATLNGNITLNNSSFTNYASGASVTAILTQDGTGSRILTSTQIKWAGGSSTLSTTASAIDIVNFYYDGTTWYGSLVKGYV
jgi:hypothetical protein